MSAEGSWAELLFLMVHGPDRPMRGRIRSHEGEEPVSYAYSVTEGDPLPTLVHGSTDVIDAWCWGSRVRIADPDGELRLISDGTTAWTFGEDGAAPVESPRDRVHFVLGGTDLLVRSRAEEWLGDDFTRPTGPPRRTTFLGREAWQVELAPPDHKPHPVRLVVDAETGMVLQRRNDAFGTVTEWTALSVGEDLEPALFTWTGPVVTWAQRREESRRAAEAERSRHARWLADQLGVQRLTVTVEVEIELHVVEDDGSMHASIPPVGSLRRRPRSDAPWDEVGPEEDPELHRWHDADWDWALHAWGAPLAPGALASLQARLARR